MPSLLPILIHCHGVESHYLLNMESTEFEREMEDIKNFVEEHNRKRSLEIGIRDARLL